MADMDNNRPITPAEMELGDRLREVMSDYIGRDIARVPAVVHVMLGEAGALLEAIACCSKHFAGNVNDLAAWFAKTCNTIHAERQTKGECSAEPDPVPAPSVTVTDKNLHATPAEVEANPDPYGLVAYAGQSFGKQGLRPLFMICLHREAFEYIVGREGGYDVEIEIGGARLNLRLFGRETRKQALDLIAARIMSPETVAAVEEMQKATKQ